MATGRPSASSSRASTAPGVRPSRVARRSTGPLRSVTGTDQDALGPHHGRHRRDLGDRRLGARLVEGEGRVLAVGAEQALVDQELDRVEGEERADQDRDRGGDAEEREGGAAPASG